MCIVIRNILLNLKFSQVCQRFWLDHILEAENEETSQIHKCAINRKSGASKHKYSMLEHNRSSLKWS